jgi:hypothetical protein
MIICVPSASRIFAPPSLGACLDGLASNSGAADDHGALGRSYSLLTLGPTLPYGGRLPASGCGPEAHEAAPQVLVRDGISGRLDVMPDARVQGDIAETYEHLRCRGTGRCDELTARRCAGSPSGRKIVNLGAHNGTQRTGTDGAKFGPFVEPDRASEGILGVTAMRATPGPRLAARRRRFAGDQREVAAMARAGRRAPREPVRDEVDA